MTTKGLATTFTDDEVKVAMFIVRMINRGGDPRMARKHPAWPSLVRKFQKMEHKSVAPPAGASPEEVARRQDYLDQGYTPAEVEQIMQLRDGKPSPRIHQP